MNRCSDCGHTTFFDWTGYRCPECNRFPEPVVSAFQESSDRIPAELHEQIRAQISADSPTNEAHPADVRAQTQAPVTADRAKNKTSGADPTDGSAAEWLYRLHPIPEEESEMLAYAGRGPVPLMYLHKVIDEIQREGWDYCDTITTSRLVRPGCLQALFLGGRSSYAMTSVLLFRRRRPSASPAVPTGQDLD